ncbi:3-oxoacyl-[acyl-carrier-protein] synthase, mitochondrial-like [Rhagoletis pomonella]|uniref:3-oxoacyl-[acyl-carrier-protein] synthase, mitochondrial-like n=1 Tax=Rhagoletis pomonella TaxID=28610 RepID=UPI00177CC80E|nr:3-oxoacyl-[acyl-carrier-protein] synthase, mitochondrial-like [Rhagoletis pomonella]
MSLPLSSTKGAHGHLLGSSGNLEAVFVVQACAENQLPPSINIEHLDESISVPIVQNKSEKWHQDTKARRIALKNSFGFGGTNASICIADYRD